MTEKIKKTTKKDNTTVSAIKDLAEAIRGLEQKIDNYYNINQVVNNSTAPGSIGTVAISPEESTGTTGMEEQVFPLEWRMVIDEILSPAFRAKVNFRSDGKFELSIFVPKEFSNARPADWELNNEDKRFKIIESAMGEMGVREYAMQIAENLGPDIRDKIAKSKLNLPQSA